MKNGGDKYKTIRAIPWPLRVTVPLVIGQKYFFSFGSQKVQACTLIDIIEEQNWPLRVQIEPEKRGVFGFKYHTFYADELGRTPTEAIMNEVTF